MARPQAQDSEAAGAAVAASQGSGMGSKGQARLRTLLPHQPSAHSHRQEGDRKCARGSQQNKSKPKRNRVRRNVTPLNYSEMSGTPGLVSAI